MRMTGCVMVVLILGTLLISDRVGGAQIGGEFSLTDQHGERFHLHQLRGRVVLLFFGYTYCPDVCPTELATIAAVLGTLEKRAADVQGLFVSVDPERDTPEILNEYVRYFHPSLIGLTGTPGEIARVAEQYHVRFTRNALEDGGYSIEHSAQLYVIDRDGALVSAIPYGLPAEHLLNVLDDLLASVYRGSTTAIGGSE